MNARTVPLVPRYPRLSSHLKAQLEAITPSIDGELEYYPCLVRLNDGTEMDRVYVVSEEQYVRQWILYPDQDSGKVEVRIGDVVSIIESPSRLPARFANELYRAGESGMGYTVFTVVFSKRFGLFPSRRDFVSGNAIDFIEYPPGRGPDDVTAVLPHVGRRDAGFRPGPKYSWCIFSE
jgi:hypothetical protein